MQLARRFHSIRAQCAYDTQERGALGLSSSPELLGGALLRSAEIADRACLLSIGEVAEVAHQRGHPALVALRVTDHLADLLLLLLTMGNVRVAPTVMAEADIFCEIERGPAVDPQLLEGFVENIHIHLQLLL